MSKTPLPHDTCAKCGFDYYTHTGISRYCPESAHEQARATNSTFTAQAMSEPKLTEAEIQQINVEARAYAETLVDPEDVDGTPQYICFIKGATLYAKRLKQLNEDRNDERRIYEALLKSKDNRWEEVRKQVIVYRDGIKLDLLDKHTPLAEVTALRIRVEETEKWLSLLSEPIKTETEKK